MAVVSLVSSYSGLVKNNPVEVVPTVKLAERVPLPSGDYQLNKNGSLITPVEFRIYSNPNEIFHSNKIIFLVYSTDYFWDRLGGVTLTNGINFSYIIKHGTPDQRVIWDITFKDFAELSAFTEDIFIGNSSTSTGHVVWRHVFNFKYIDSLTEKIELNPSLPNPIGGGILRFLVQDNITAIPSFRVFASGVSELF